MKLRQLTMVLIAVLAGTAPSVASAALSSDFHISLGYTGLNLTAGETYSDTLESMSALDLNYNL